MAMLSRVAESTYWMSRYLERAENIARFIDVHWYLTLDLPSLSTDDWAPLISITGEGEAFYKRHEVANRENVIHFLTFDTGYSSSILSCVNQARENARGIREMISPDLWEEVNSLYHHLKRAAQNPERVYGRMREFYADIKRAGLLFGGVVNDTMMHGESWHFFRMGRLLERADKTSRILDVKYFILLPKVEFVGTPYDNIQWAALLRSTSALETYRRTFGPIEPSKVVHFLMLHDEFPRSVRHCLGRVDESIRFITHTPPGYFANPAGQHLGQLLAELSFTTVDQIIGIGLHEYIDSLQTKLNKLDNHIHTSFFDIPLPGSQQQRQSQSR